MYGGGSQANESLALMGLLRRPHHHFWPYTRFKIFANFCSITEP
jgi:hypothetical protein